MSIEVTQTTPAESGHEAHGEHEEYLAHQFEDRAQQDETYVVGMWAFLVTEVLFFGALFLAYSIWRSRYPEVFLAAHEELDYRIGGLNTFILLTSSLTMALAVHAAQVKNRIRAILLILVTMVFAFAFLVLKVTLEWIPKGLHHLVPGSSFHWPPEGVSVAAQHVDPGKAQMFFGLYFAMTGLHGIHVVLGLITMAILVVMLLMKRKEVEYYMPIEMTGLYWHFVDIVWIFLYPLFYLIGK